MRNVVRYHTERMRREITALLLVGLGRNTSYVIRSTWYVVPTAGSKSLPPLQFILDCAAVRFALSPLETERGKSLFWMTVPYRIVLV